MTEVEMAMNGPADEVDASTLSLRPRFKISELPLAKEQRSAIDALLFKFKKQGGYDTLRKQVWAAYNTSEAKDLLTQSINRVAEEEIDKDPKLLGRNRGTAATLIQGAVDRSGVYQEVESRLDKEILKHLDGVLESVRTIRKADIGEEKALEEQNRGSKTDDQYAAETEQRATERQTRREKLDRLARETAALKAKLRAHEEKKAREETLKKVEEERKRKEAEEEARRLDRQRRQEEEERRELERIKARDERAKKREEERLQREVEYEAERQEREKRRKERDSRDPSRHTRRDSVDVRKEPLTEKDLEAAALESLLNEGKEHARRSSTRKEYDHERDERKPRKRDRSVDSYKKDEKRSKSRERKSRTRESAHRDTSHDVEEGEAEGTPSPVVTRRRPRSASPVGIDRYVPGGGVHRSIEERERDRDKPRKIRDTPKASDRTKTATERRYESYTGSTTWKSEEYATKETEDRDRRRDAHREGDRERPRERERDRDRDDRDKERDRERRRSRSPARKRDDRDRRDDRRDERRNDYRERDGRDRERDRDRDRERDRDRDRYKSSSHRDSHDEYRPSGHREDRGRDDRYRESGRRDGKERDREVDRHSRR